MKIDISKRDDDFEPPELKKVNVELHTMVKECVVEYLGDGEESFEDGSVIHIFQNNDFKEDSMEDVFNIEDDGGDTLIMITTPTLCLSVDRGIFWAALLKFGKGEVEDMLSQWPEQLSRLKGSDTPGDSDPVEGNKNSKE